MDPVTIAIAGTFGGAVILRWIEKKLASSNDTGSITISYDERWTDPKYVAMIHQTIEKEKVELGEARSVCECKTCTTANIPVVSNKRPVESGEWQHIDRGYLHIMPPYVPRDARIEPVPFSFESGMNKIYAIWYNTVTGQPMRYISVSMTPAAVGRQIRLSPNLDSAVTSSRQYEDYHLSARIPDNRIVHHRDWFLNEGRTSPVPLERETIRK